MLYKVISPIPVLTDIIKCYRLMRMVFPTHTTVPFKAYPPRPEQTLSFFPRQSERIEYPNGQTSVQNVRSSLVGQHHFVMNRFPYHDFLMIQVVFQPSGLFKLTGIPAIELANSYLDAETIFSSELKKVNDRLSGASHFSEMMKIIEIFFQQLVAKRKADTHALDQVSVLILQNPPNLSLDWLARQSFLSSKQFERKFQERIGINPKYFTRISRFDHAFRMKNRFPKKDWLSIAMDCGYYDYQHLAKDYKEFTGQTPVAFYQQETQSPERLLGLVET